MVREDNVKSLMMTSPDGALIFNSLTASLTVNFNKPLPLLKLISANSSFSFTSSSGIPLEKTLWYGLNS